ncbi:MAG: hypothetical protein QXJ21_08540 [Thermofilum sp.]
MTVEEAISRYIQLVDTKVFVKHAKELAYKIQVGLHKGYIKGRREPEIVQIIENIINEVNGLSTFDNKFNISTKAVFIHGNKSQVIFKYLGKDTQCELGDIIFILSVIYNKKKYFEKMTITQVKNSKENRYTISWNLSKKYQLYLLSRFPPFRGAGNSIFPAEEFYLANHSKCLGSYVLLLHPIEDLIFISSSLLEIILGNNKFLYCNNSFKQIKALIYYLENRCTDIDTCLMSPHVLGYSWFASNVHEFTDRYLRGYIGEMIYSDVGRYNKSALLFLHKLLEAIRLKAERINDKTLLNFVDSFFKYPYSRNRGEFEGGVDFGYEGGGIGIIHTLIDLGE